MRNMPDKHALSRRTLLRSAVVAPALLAPGLAPPAAGAAVDWSTCQRLARDLLLIGPDGSDLTLAYLRVLIDDGLPRTTRPRRVLVIGAGMAGLVAAHLLRTAGHRVVVLEANGNRLGGRLKTFRHDPARGVTTPFADPRQYAEAGGMRIPDAHPLTLALVDKLGLRRQLFYNVDVDPATGAPGAVPPVIYRSFTGEVWRNGPDVPALTPPRPAGRTWIGVNGAQVRRAGYRADPAPINAAFGMTSGLSIPAGQLLDAALEPVHDYHSVRMPDGRVPLPMPQRLDGWARVIRDFDHMSMQRFLTEHRGLETAAVDAIGTLENLTSRLPLSFLHSYLGRATINPTARFWELEGGSWRLPYAFEPLLAGHIRYDRRVTAIRHDPSAVRVETVTEAGRRHRYTGDVAIVTVPFSALRHVDIRPLLSYAKRRAIMELHYDSATKVLLEFSRRWWEFTEDDWNRELDAVRAGADMLGAASGMTIPAGRRVAYARLRSADSEPRPADAITGGGSVTDNPNRFAYYPSHPVPGSRGGVVLASYCWANDASRWDSMPADDRYAYALRGLADLHGRRIEVFATGRDATQSWMLDPYAFGEAAVFTPGQLTELHPAIPTAEGPLHFAGEHTSLKHSWIEGAVESGIRTALEVNRG
jgi:monoamine oxidase